MKKSYSLFLVCLLSFACIQKTAAACLAGESEITIEIQTDDYGYEGYWELVPFGNACGVGTLQFGGNSSQVGCAGSGTPYTATSGSGYGNNTTITAGPFCYPTGNVYSIKYVDDYNDGGFTFVVKINGFPMYTFSGNGSPSTFTFNNTPPPAFDLGITEIHTPLYDQTGMKIIAGSLFNYGSSVITSFDLNYSINGGTTQTQTISSVSIPGYTSYDYTHSIPWNVSSNGSYNIDVWASNLNSSNPDMNNTNDHQIKTTIIGNPIPNIIDDYLHANTNLTVIANSADGILEPRDLDFHPILTRNELWVVLKNTEALGGKTAKITDAGLSSQATLIQKDENSWHFMSLPTGIAFSDNGNFSTSPGVLDANHGSGSSHFTGPTLWDSNPLVYAMPSGGNGSHIDMLHQCPYAMGVTWEKDNVFWVFDGYNNDLMRCDFQKDHGPGNDDHSDAKIRSYDDILVTYSTLEIPCHMALDAEKKWLYIVNGGSSQIYRMDITTGSQTGTFVPYSEPLAESSVYTGTNHSLYITSGLTTPSGIDVIGNRLIVSDYSNGDIAIYDCSGSTATELGRIHTGIPGIQGLKIGPDGKIWYVNYQSNEVMRIDYTVWGVGIEESQEELLINAYPNPSADVWNFSGVSASEIVSVTLTDVVGKKIDITEPIVVGRNINFSIDNSQLASGSYQLTVRTKSLSKTIKLYKN